MIIPEDWVGILLVAALAGVVLLAILVTVLLVRMARLRRAYASALDPDRREDLFQSVERQVADLAELREDLHTVHTNTERLRELLGTTVSRVGLVRYDAFDDMGGALSFSAALLDEHATGLVISAINGRSETRCYGKPVVAGESDHNLTTEELEAIEVAREGRLGEGAPEILSTGRRRRRMAS